MNKNKNNNLGFTMMEMLATILVLLVILLIASPSIRRMLSTSNELSKSYIEEITVDAAREYATVVNKDVTKSLKKVDDTEIISLDVLINFGLIEEEDKEKLGPTASVLLTYQDDSNIKYEIIYDETIIKNNNPYIILYGSTVYVERGSVYNEPGYKAFDKDGKNITSKVIVTGTVNVSSFGMYQLTYNVTDDDNIAGDTKTRTVMVVDGTYPSATTIIATSNNPYDNKLAKNGETVTVNITFNKEVTNPKVTIGGRPATVTGSGATRTATYTIPPSESTLVNKAIEIKVSNYKDLYDNNGNTITGVTTGGAVVFDNIKPVILSSTITSNNGNNKLVKNNERLYMETNFSEAIRSVTSTLQGRATTLTGGGTAKVTSTYLIPSSESTMTEGNITGLITSYMDRAGNVGSSNSIRLVGATVFYDRTLPTCTVSYVDPAWTNGNRTVTATCGDTGGSGCLSNLSKTYNTTINTTTAGAVDNGVGGTVYDNAGNARACLANQTVRIDKELPSVTTHTPALRNWLNTDISISLSATDTGGSNIASYQYCYTTNGNTCVPSTVGNTVSFTSTGQYTVCSRAIDGAGNISATTTCSAANAYKIDKSLPSVTAHNPTSRGWLNTDISISLSATDTGGSNVASYQSCYTTNGTTCTPSTAGGTVSLTATGQYTVCSRAIDGAGNVSSTSTCSAANAYKIDKSLPSVTTHTPASRGWLNTDISISLSATDTGGSNVASYQYCSTTNGNTCTPSTAGGTVSLTATGQHTVCSRAIDGANNTGGTTCSTANAYKIDKSLPSVTAHNPTSSGWLNTDISISLSATDTGGSNIASYQSCYTTDGTNCTPSTAGGTVSLTSTGEYTVCSRAVDGAGNVSSTTTCSAANAYKIDKEPPPATAHSPTSSGWVSANISITLSAIDTGGSGTSSYQYCSTTNGTNCTPSTTGDTVSLTSTGEYTVCSRAIDEAGNTGETTCSAANAYKLDKKGPVATSHNPTSRAAASTAISIAIQLGGDDESGFSYYQYCTTKNGTNCTPGTSGGTVSLSAVGEYTVCSRAVDAVGNAGTTTCSAANAYKITSPVEKPTVTYSVAATNSSYLSVNEWAIIVPKCTSDVAISSYSVTVSGFNYNAASHKVDGSSTNNRVKKSVVTLIGHWDLQNENYTITTTCVNSGGTTTVTKNYTTLKRDKVSLQVFTDTWGSTISGVTTVNRTSTNVTFSIRSRVVVQSGSTLTRSCVTSRTYGQRTVCDPQDSVRDVTFNPETQATCGRTTTTVTSFTPCK